ncbi:MAG: hypothetical protein JEZ07_05345 [Phycisphaerae bacterium]|nr:hypothetical protein [Phycisphaerae bacterium]
MMKMKMWFSMFIVSLMVGLSNASIVKPVAVTGNIAGDAGSSVNWLLDDNGNQALPGLSDATGAAITLETGDTLAKALSTYHLRSGIGHEESWTYGTGAGNPEFIFDLGTETTIGSIVLWQYGNNGGGAGYGGNSTKDFEIIFHTAAEGNVFDFGSETVEFSGTMDEIYEITTLDNIAQFFGFDSEVSAQYVGLRIATN